MQIEQAGEFILEKLNRELSENFKYHNAAHAIDVYTAAKLIAGNEHVGEQETRLLLTAALYHDSGFLFGQKDHETRSCDNARLYLPGFGYEANEVEQICDIIMATKMPQDPHSHLGQIICDADLDYLGRNDFFVLSKKLFSELVITGGLKTEQEWDKLQIVFLENHHYFTKTAIETRGPVKQEHLKEIIKTTY
ncbi:HD domain-containing protein [Mucilaginibacter sp. SP1R1]|uniref:HD domain-containing protein n=1 Tax=Mucilaginibacter sp. SP1R1 TaxID=2723091 RepID=UPI001612B596|nr:HD domain-containing protein [Mucilaginibacter sp. SP1R1]MBB6149649.1 putative metal-dependent HD superfamily phosphohydrolase [Mucilaginibacter sp. SP1R1]